MPLDNVHANKPPPASGDDDLVIAERRGHVLLLTFNRPRRLNAWTNEMEARYFAHLEAAEADRDVRAVVVTGAGRAFCAGADMDDLSAATTTPHVVDVQRGRPRSYPMTLRKPLIAAINGAAAGLGLVEALYCDVRFCVAEAKLTTSFARLGLVAEYGISWILPRLIGSSAALDLLMSGRIVHGDEALQMGLVNRLSSPVGVVDDAVAYARELAESCSPASMAAIKAQIRRDLTESFERAAGAADELMLEFFAQPDAAEGVASYLERRPPSFPSLPARS